MTTTVGAAAAAIAYRPGTVAHHQGDFVYPGRRVVNGVWPYCTPETCRDEQPGGIWIGTADHEVLICLDAGSMPPDPCSRRTPRGPRVPTLARCTRAARRRRSAPVTVALPKACCTGRFFEHTDDCRTPLQPRPCSDCAAAPGTEHGYDCQWWWT